MKSVANSFDIIYQIHITVDSLQTDKFFEVCKELGVEGLHIRDVVINGMKDSLLTSSVVKGPYKEVYKEMFRIGMGLIDSGFEPVRVKIETVPWNYHHEKPLYHEAHFKVKAPFYNFPIPFNLIKLLGLKISMKHQSDKTMLTYRTHDLKLSDFEDNVNSILKILRYEVNTLVQNPIIEMTIYDSNIHYDSNWG